MYIDITTAIAVLAIITAVCGSVLANRKADKALDNVARLSAAISGLQISFEKLENAMDDLEKESGKRAENLSDRVEICHKYCTKLEEDIANLDKRVEEMGDTVQPDADQEKLFNEALSNIMDYNVDKAIDYESRKHG